MSAMSARPTTTPATSPAGPTGCAPRPVRTCSSPPPDPPPGPPRRASVVLDAQEVLLGQELVQPGLVDAADDGAFLLAVAHALGQRERRGDDVQQADREEAAHPA